MKVLFFGDSLTEGTVGVGFIPFLEQMLPDDEYVNLGVNGETILGLRHRIERMAPRVRGDTAIVWIGTNDVLMYPDWDGHAAAAAYDYEKILRLAAARAGKVVAVPPLLADPGFARQHERSLAGATGMMHRLSEAAGAGYIDIQAAFTRHPGTEFTIDGAHLNSAGARLVAETFAAHLRTVLA